MPPEASGVTKEGGIPRLLTWGGGFVLLLLALGAIAQATLLSVLGGLVLVVVALAVVPATRGRIENRLR
ncbi:hypothetical protein ACFPYI_14895 [Halomarina salina]|uniref:Uncharacterized protein n=1 Tax=Halomarina salina TaxID=1872699 RepID=A0ABD5RQE6_9EURY|nr:hypothetical protein [Halomarina salina]